MPSLTVTQAQRTRAQRMADLMKAISTQGLIGAETLAPSSTLEQWTNVDPAQARAGFYPAVMADGPWTAFIYQPSWGSWGAPYRGGEWRLEVSGIVRLRGLVQGVGGIGSGVPITILPVPPAVAPVTFWVLGDNKGCRVEIDTLGSLAVLAGDSATPESFVSLDGITFDALG